MKNYRRYVIVKKYNSHLQADKKYWRDELTGFINGIAGACFFHSYDHAEETLAGLTETGIFQIETIHVKE